VSSPTKLRQMAKELGWPPELEKAADQLQKLERENAALNHALNIAQTELRLNWCAKAADEVAKLHDAARKEAQP